MLRPFLKPQNLRRAISLSNYAKGCSTNLNLVDPNAVKRKTNLVDQSPNELSALRKPTTVRKSTTSLDNLIKNVNACKTLACLFDLIQPHLTEPPTLTDEHLNAIFYKLNDLFFNQSEFDKERMSESKRILSNSPVFKSLMSQTNRRINALGTSSLLCLLHTFSLASLDPNFLVVKRTITELDVRLDVLELDAVIECAKQLHYYLGTAFTPQLFDFNNRVLQSLKKDLLVNRFDPQNVKATVNYWFIFLKPENDPQFEVAKYMAKQLLAPDVKLSFEQAVLLMRKIKLNHYLYRERLNKPNCYGQMRDMYRGVEFEFRKRNLFPKIIAELVDKCNTVIYETLCLQATTENFNYFYNKLHDFTYDISHELPNFYASKILFFVVPHLVQNIESSDRLKGIAFELLQNYAKFNIYDEKLIKLAYDLYLRDEKLRSKIDGSHFLFILTKYRLPFVDHRYLGKLLVSFSTKFHKSTETKANPLRVLCELILNDVEDETLLSYLNDAVSNLSNEYYENFKSINHFKQIALAKHYLSTKTGLKEDLKSKLETTLNAAIHAIHFAGKKPKISHYLFLTDNRLQKNGYLSNGVYLDTFAIYDSLIAGLVPMTYKLIDQFKHKVDRIPRTDNQEMYGFRNCKQFKLYN